MTWNHRVLRHQGHQGPYFAVHEVYYTNGKPDAWTSAPIELLGDTLEDIREELAMIQRALDTPILEIVGEKLQEVRD